MRHWGVQEGVTSNDFALIKWSISSIPNYSEPKRSFSSSDMQCKRRGSEGGIPQSLIQLLIFLRFISQVNKNAVCPKNTDNLDNLPRYMHNHNKNWGILALTGLMCLHTSSLIHPQHQQLAEISIQGGWVCVQVGHCCQVKKLYTFQHLTKCTTTMPHPVGLKYAGQEVGFGGL